jgi:membrane protein DedA with SNARE-associated domain
VADALGWYISIFLWLLFTGIGLPPCPEEAGILYAAGVTALHPEVRWWLAWPAAIAGILCADTVLYGAGRLWGERLFERAWVQRVIPPERRLRLQARFHDHGLKILLTARFLPPLRTGVFLIAGAIRYSFARFLIADAAYLVVGVGVLFFGSAGLINLLHRVGHWLVYVLAGAAAMYGLVVYYKRLRQRESTICPPPVSIVEEAARLTTSASGGNRDGASAHRAEKR